MRPLHLLALPSGSAMAPSPGALLAFPPCCCNFPRGHCTTIRKPATLDHPSARAPPPAASSPHCRPQLKCGTPPARLLNLSSLAIVALCCRRRRASGLRAHRLSLRQSRPSPRKGSSERPSVEQRRELAIGLARGLRPRSLHCVAVTRPLPSQ